MVINTRPVAVMVAALQLAAFHAPVFQVARAEGMCRGNAPANELCVFENASVGTTADFMVDQISSEYGDLDESLVGFASSAESCQELLAANEMANVAVFEDTDLDSFCYFYCFPSDAETVIVPLQSEGPFSDSKVIAPCSALLPASGVVAFEGFGGYGGYGGEEGPGDLEEVPGAP